MVHPGYTCHTMFGAVIYEIIDLLVLSDTIQIIYLSDARIHTENICMLTIL
jgi:hypothetical protein